MPVYDYDCAQCGRRFEIVHGVHADSPRVCSLCGGGPVRKAISAPTVHFKGSGWAKPDRRSAAAASAKAGGDASGSGGDESGGGSKVKTETVTKEASANTKEASANTKEAGANTKEAGANTKEAGTTASSSD